MNKFITFVLLTLAFTRTVVADDYIVIVIDTSGSMEDKMRSVDKTRMNVAQDALIGVLSKIPSTTKVGILTFNGWVYDIQNVDREELVTAIRSTSPSGGTPLYQFISDGATRLLEEREKQGNIGSYKLLVVTDGAASDNYLNEDSFFGDDSEKPGVLKDILNRSIAVDAIGLDIAEDHALATQINGIYMRGDDPESLSKAITKSVAEVGFGTNQDASDESFKEISELPEGFVLASLKGLTTFSNQPIGRKSPVEVVQEDGTIIIVPNPANVEKGGFTFLIMSIFSFVIVLVLFVAFVANKSGGR